MLYVLSEGHFRQVQEAGAGGTATPSSLPSGQKSISFVQFLRENIVLPENSCSSIQLDSSTFG